MFNLENIFKKIENMSFDEFKESHHVLTFYSKIMEDHFILVPNEEILNKMRKRLYTVYTLDEIQKLSKLRKPASIKAIHELKKQFPGTSVDRLWKESNLLF